MMQTKGCSRQHARPCAGVIWSMLAAFFCLWAADDAHAQAPRQNGTLAIEWEPINRFRLFGRQSDALLSEVYERSRSSGADHNWIAHNWRDFVEVAAAAMFVDQGYDPRCFRDGETCPGGRSFEQLSPAALRAEYDQARNARFLFRLDAENYVFPEDDRPHRRGSYHAWDRAAHAFDERYILPNAYRVRLRLNGLGALARGQCEWTIQSDGYTSDEPLSAPCSQAVETRVRATWPARRAQSGPVRQSAHVEVRVAGTESVVAARRIEFEDLLIVGMGDSFASGEGAPDVPANWSALAESKLTPSMRQALTNVAGPSGAGWIASRVASENVAGAIWFDQQCHRSLLSWQAVSAMALAAEWPNAFVTYVSFACGGGSTVDGLLLPQLSPPGGRVFAFQESGSSASVFCSQPEDQGSEALRRHYRGLSCPGSATRVPLRSQIDQLLHTICGGGLRSPSPTFIAYLNMERGSSNNMEETLVRGERCRVAPQRQVDELFVTLAGNDIGFAEVVMWTLVPHSANTPLRNLLVERLNRVMERTKCGYEVRDDPRCANWLEADTDDGYLERDRPPELTRCRRPEAVDVLRDGAQAPLASYLIDCYLDLTLPAFQSEMARSGMTFAHTTWSAYPNPVWRAMQQGRRAEPGQSGNTPNDRFLCGVDNDATTSEGTAEFAALQSLRGAIDATSRLHVVGPILGPLANFSGDEEYGLRAHRSESHEVSQQVLDTMNDAVRRLVSGDALLTGVVIDDYLGPQPDSGRPGATDHILDSPADGRGWCAVNADDEDSHNDGFAFGDLTFPRFDRRSRQWIGGQGPDLWDANAGHARLFRTPNDAVLTQYAAPPPPSGVFPQLNANVYQLRNGFGGMMHPGAEIHAIMASAAVRSVDRRAASR